MQNSNTISNVAAYQIPNLASTCGYGGYQAFGSIIDPYSAYSPYYVSDIIATDDDDGHHRRRDNDDDNDI